MNTIMIVDDDVPIGNMLEEVLTKEGYGVCRAYSGTEALLVLADNRPDLVLLDLMLPGLKGEEILPELEGIPELLQLVGLQDTGKKKVKNFSLGMRQRLGIAVALAGNPDFLMLDEPVNGLDPQGIIEIRELILKLNREQQVTVLISSHILDELSRLATDYGFIDKGHMLKEISAEELESECRKCTRLEVTDINTLIRVMDDMGWEYSVLSERRADVFAKVNITQMALALADRGCEILSLQERDESLESYFINLIGGDGNEQAAKCEFFPDVEK